LGAYRASNTGMTESALDYALGSVQTSDQLQRVWCFAASVLRLPAGPHTLEHYRAKLAETPQLLVFAEREDRICGCVLASIEGDHVLVGPVAVAEDSRRMGIGTAMMQELEKQAKGMGQHTLILGALEDAEAFYLSCRFQPNLFIQVPGLNAGDQLQSLNVKYEVMGSWEQDGWSRLTLRTPTIDKGLQREYERRFPDCATQYVFMKHI
jgi:GNAT superfamily N-acetyltransferase